MKRFNEKRQISIEWVIVGIGVLVLCLLAWALSEGIIVLTRRLFRWFM